MRSKKTKTYSKPAPVSIKNITHTFYVNGIGGIITWEGILQVRNEIKRDHPQFRDRDIELDVYDYEVSLVINEVVPNDNYQQEYEAWQEAKDIYEGKITAKDKLKRKIDRLQKKLVSMGE